MKSSVFFAPSEGLPGKKLALVLFLTVLTAGSVFSFDFKSFPDPITKGNILISPGFGLGSFYSGWDSSVMIGGTVAVDYALPIDFALTLGGELGISGAELKGWNSKGGIGFVPILFRAAWHPNWEVKNLDTYAMLKLGFGLGFWTGDAKDSDALSGFMYGFDIGGRYFFTDSIGAFVELGFEYAFLRASGWNSAFANKFLTLGVTFKLGGAKK